MATETEFITSFVLLFSIIIGIRIYIYFSDEAEKKAQIKEYERQIEEEEKMKKAREKREANAKQRKEYFKEKKREEKRLAYRKKKEEEKVYNALSDEEKAKLKEIETERKLAEKKIAQEKEKKRSRTITQKVKDDVWNRDGGKCVECDSNENLEFDHIIPHSKGGANTYRNIQLLCQDCNRTKSAKIG